MKAAVVSLITIIALVTSVLAQTRKVLVLPLDGNTPAAQRTALNASVARLATDKIGGDVSIGETTFEETAAAVGCSPELASCAEQVRVTLAVDELVYGTANTADATTTVTVMRASAGSPAPRAQISVISESDPGEQAEAGMAPLFTADPEGTGSGSDLGSGSAEPSKPTTTFFSTTERKLAVGFLASGAISLVIGFSLWSGASSLQGTIDDHPRSTLAEINDLKDLEDDAGSKALWGNVLVVLGVAAGGVGGYFLWKDKKNRENATTITPQPAEAGTGMTFVVRGRW
jgi:hypothetical protein